jgi:hypothetical protein
MMFWIIAGAVAVLLAVVWWWAGKHSTVRGNVRGYRIDQLTGNAEGEDTLIRYHGPNPPAGPF